MAKTDQVARSRPFSPAVLAELGALKGLSPPTEPLDPEGAWSQTYRIWAVANTPAMSNVGFLQIQRKPSEDRKSATFDVEKALGLFQGHVYRTKAEIECAADAVASLRSWSIESGIWSMETGKEIEVTRVRELVTLQNGKLRVHTRSQTLVREVPEPLTSDWGLFDAVQRLPGATTTPLDFAMLEELDMLKEDQRLSYRETAEFEVEGKKLRCLRYQQLGRGVLPYEYWVDEKHHLLIAFSHTRAYILDPSVEGDWTKVASRPGRAAR